jgi:hypothetical protein
MRKISLTVIALMGIGILGGCAGQADLAATNAQLEARNAAMLTPPGGNNSTLNYSEYTHQEPQAVLAHN